MKNKKENMSEEISRARFEEKKRKVIHSNIYDPHTQFSMKPPVGFELNRNLKKRAFAGQFKQNSNNSATGFKQLLKQTGSVSEIVNAQRRFHITRADPNFKKEKEKINSEYKYKRII